MWDITLIKFQSTQLNHKNTQYVQVGIRFDEDSNGM